MAANPARYGVSQPAEPVVHDLPSIRVANTQIPIRLAAWRADDGTWRGRLVFGPPEAQAAPTTADIFCAASESDLWQSVRDLREHHLRDLYRSLVP
ncbi:MAG: hypothetical protein HY560_07240 [Gemmatimonadetes bacterium]|nr:hypothetical protein [Gemmatimonadota bacterium]